MIKYKVIGIMSGTSLDGLDIAYCEFCKNKRPVVSGAEPWEYKIIHAETKKYSKEWEKKLRDAFKRKKKKLDVLDIEYGNYIGIETWRFIKQKKLFPDFIASHGHTIFHRPENKITLQIGNGEEIASMCKLPVVCDFRSEDVALGGQGAPLVPIADRMLFSKYAFCLNLGGFANISFDNAQRERIAYDICPVNIVLNDLANKFGKEFDKGGKMASQGEIHDALLKKLNALPFYKIKPPKSLGREWVEKIFLPVLHSYDISIQDKLRTVCEHIAIRIDWAVNRQLLPINIGTDCQLLITGGGAYNDFLMERISIHTRCKIIVPDDKTIQFKEAMAFAFLGALKIRREINILKSVTGAKKDSSAGKIYLPD